MIAKYLPMLVALTSLSLCLGAWANDMDPETENYTALKAPGPIELDGDLSEWGGANLLENPRFAIPKSTGWEDASERDRVTHEEWADGTWDGPDDHSSTIRVMYDDESVYLGIIVTDDYHEHAASGGGGTWNGDSLQLIFTDDERSEQVSLVNIALLGIEEEMPGEGNVPGEDNGDSISVHNESAAEGTEAFIVRDTTAKTTTYEVRFPIEVVSFDLEELVEGVKFGLGIDINDGDEDSPGQSGWSGWGPHGLVVGGKTPFEAGLVTLGGIPPGLPFQITDIRKEGTDVTITWPSTEGAGYTIERATPAQLIEGDFEELDDGFEGEPGDTTSYTDSEVTDEEFYYRVRAE